MVVVVLYKRRVSREKCLINASQSLNSKIFSKNRKLVNNIPDATDNVGPSFNAALLPSSIYIWHLGTSIFKRLVENKHFVSNTQYPNLLWTSKFNLTLDLITF